MLSKGTIEVWVHRSSVLFVIFSEMEYNNPALPKYKFTSGYYQFKYGSSRLRAKHYKKLIKDVRDITEPLGYTWNEYISKFTYTEHDVNPTRSIPTIVMMDLTKLKENK